MEIISTMKEFLESNQILALATTDGKHAYCCNLHYYSDDSMNLYFVSRAEREHSKNILSHKHVAVAIYDAVRVTDNKVTGIQIKWICTPFTVNDGLDIINAYYKKFPEKFTGEIQEILEKRDFRSFFKIETKRIRMIDGHSWDTPFEITL